MNEKDEKYAERIIECISKDIVQDVDGYYYFWPSANRGHFSEYALRVIANHLEKLNKPWDNQVNEYFNTMPDSGWKKGDVDRQSGAFEQWEIDNANAWR